MKKSKKITKATFKAFVRKNEGKIFINCKSSFDGMVDCVMPLEGGFVPLQRDDRDYGDTVSKATLGYNGIWLVNGSRDWYGAYENENYTGIEVCNCCGAFIVVIKKEA